MFKITSPKIFFSLPKNPQTARFSFCTIHTNSCFYDVLGVGPSATAHDIKHAYYARVKEYHPDHNKTSSAEEKFKIIAQAYDVLKDPVERKLYDFHKTSSRGSSTMNSTTQDFYQRAARPTGGTTTTRTTSRTSSYYRNGNDYYYTGFHSNSGCDYSEAWERYNNQQENAQNLRSKYYYSYGSTATPPAPTLFNTLLGRMAIIVGLFGLYEMWRRQKYNGMGTNKIPHVKAGPTLSLGQMEFETHTGWGREDRTSTEKLQEEMKRKGFRIEYAEKRDNGNSEKKMRKVIKKRERKLPGLDEYVAKKNFKVQKSTVPAMRSF